MALFTDAVLPSFLVKPLDKVFTLGNSMESGDRVFWDGKYLNTVAGVQPL
jgi:hypothetical protein